MLEGKNVNLRVREKDDLPLFADWMSKPEVFGEYNPLRQVSRTDMEMNYDKGTVEQMWFIIEKKDGGKIGVIGHYAVVHPIAKHLEIGFFLIPSERGKGYGTEAAKIIVDYLFLSRDVTRVQACADTRNVASQRALEKTGFKKEGTMRKYAYLRGQLRDFCLYSVLKEEWKEPQILTKTT